MSKAVAFRDTKLDSGKELTKSNPFLFQDSSEKYPQTGGFATGRSQNKLRSEIWAGVF
jgi:hypothetical protein